MSLPSLWFVIIATVVAAYAALDGFDLGTGTIYPFLAQDEEEKSVLRRAVGPFWDGNEVWLLVAGGSLFAAFPPVYATLFSGFYLPLMLVVFALIFRAVSLEFRAHDPAWAQVWDLSFFAGSAVPALLFGVVAGNLVRGIPLGPSGDYVGTFLALLNPYAILTGVTGLTLLVGHGAAWTTLKSRGSLQERARVTFSRAQWALIGLLAVLTAWTALALGSRLENLLGGLAGWLILLALAAGVAEGRLGAMRKRDGQMFLGSTLTVIGVVGIWAASTFPQLVPASPHSVGTSLTVANSASSDLSLKILLIIAGLGLPPVVAYTFLVYHTFRERLETRGAAEGSAGGEQGEGY